MHVVSGEDVIVGRRFRTQELVGARVLRNFDRDFRIFSKQIEKLRLFEIVSAGHE